MAFVLSSPVKSELLCFRWCGAIAIHLLYRAVINQLAVLDAAYSCSNLQSGEVVAFFTYGSSNLSYTIGDVEALKAITTLKSIISY